MMDLGGQLPVTLNRDSSKFQLILDQYRNQHVHNKVYCKSTKEAHSRRTYKMDNSQPLQ